MNYHDGFYKRIFGFPEMVASYLQDYVERDFVARLDMDTLELASGHYVSDDLHSRENDVVWKVKWKGEDAHLYVMIEAQRTQDPRMAERLLNYTSALWLKLGDVAASSKETVSPPVFPLVIYNGDDPWTVPTELPVRRSAQAKHVLEFLPDYSYYVLDENRIPKDVAAAKPGFASLFVRLEQAGSPAEMNLVVAECVARLASPRYIGLNHALAAWVKHVFLLNYHLATEAELKVIEDLQGVNTFMEKKMRMWFAEREAVGEARGEARGEVKTLRRVLVAYLQTGLGGVLEAIRVLIANSANAGMLESLLKQAYKVKDLSAFVPQMEKALRDAECGRQGA